MAARRGAGGCGDELVSPSRSSLAGSSLLSSTAADGETMGKHKLTELNGEEHWKRGRQVPPAGQGLCGVPAVGVETETRPGLYVSARLFKERWESE